MDIEAHGQIIADRQRDSVRAKSRERHKKTGEVTDGQHRHTKTLQATNKRRYREMTHTGREENRRDKYSKRQINKGDITVYNDTNR